MSAHSPIAIVVFSLSKTTVTKKKRMTSCSSASITLFPSCLLFSLSEACMAPIVIIWRPARTSTSWWLCIFCFSPMEKNQTQETCTSTSMTEQGRYMEQERTLDFESLAFFGFGCQEFQTSHACSMAIHTPGHACSPMWLPADQCRLSLTTNWETFKHGRGNIFSFLRCPLNVHHFH